MTQRSLPFRGGDHPIGVAMLEGYIASSADGFVADTHGGVGFLDAYQDADFGYDAFLAQIDGIVMGRATYDQIAGWDIPWPYPGTPCHVLTSTDLIAPLEGVQRWSEGLATYAAAMVDRTIWVLGGARLLADCIAQGLMHRLQLFLIPVLLGRGVPLFPHDGPLVSLTLTAQMTHANGVVALDYRLGRGDA